MTHKDTFDDTNTSAIEFYTELGLEERTLGVSPGDLQVIVNIARESVGQSMEVGLVEGRRKLMAGIVIADSVAQHYPQLLKNSEEMMDNVEVSEGLARLIELGVTDIEPFMPDHDAAKFDEPSESSDTMVTQLGEIIARVVEYQEEVAKGPSDDNKSDDEGEDYYVSTGEGMPFDDEEPLGEDYKKILPDSEEVDSDVIDDVQY